MGSKEVFQFVPFLHGKWLYYHEYFSLIGFVVFLMVFMALYLINWITRQLINPVPANPLMRKHFNATSFDLVLGVLERTTKVLSILVLQVLLVPISMFRLIPTLLSMIWGTVVGLYGIRSMQRENNGGYRETSGRLGTLVKALILINGIVTPMLFKNGCLCFFSVEASIFPSIYLPMHDEIGVDTQFSRWLWGKKWCHDSTVPCHVYTTLPEDGERSVFVNVHTSREVEQIFAHYGNVTVASTLFTFDDLEEMGQRSLHVFLLENLTPDTLYNITLSWQGYAGNQTYAYRTMPVKASIERPIIIVNGGDVGNTEPARRIWDVLSLYNVDAISIGGDIAYDDNIVDCYWTYDNFLHSYEQMNTKIGRMVPLILGLGNHDVGLNANSGRKVVLDERSAKPMTLTFFPQNGGGRIPGILERQAYHYHRFGGIILFALDSGYMSPFGGEQGKFIDDAIVSNPSQVRMAMYHVPQYSTCYNEQLDQSYLVDGQEEWIKRFDRYGFQAIFENHVHAFKRTLPITNNAPAENGTIYFGDGNWGADFFGCEINQHSNIAHTGIYNSVWISKWDGAQLHNYALDQWGSFFDQVHQNITN